MQKTGCGAEFNVAEKTVSRKKRLNFACRPPGFPVTFIVENSSCAMLVFHSKLFRLSVVAKQVELGGQLPDGKPINL